MQELILVNEQDEQVGTCEKMKAHEQGLLHRAYSVFIFNKKGEMLLQQRAFSKYHSGGLWTNACCSHPYEGEQTLTAAEKRLFEEMGFTVSLTPAFTFIYKAYFDNGLTEYEYDHVLIGEYDDVINFNADEVNDYCYKPIEEIKQSIILQPENYTEWFKIALPKLELHLTENK